MVGGYLLLAVADPCSQGVRGSRRKGRRRGRGRGRSLWSPSCSLSNENLGVAF